MMPKAHLEVLPEEQKKVWDIFQSSGSPLQNFHFYLAGGTALALHIGHRQSIDFDFFSEQNLTRTTIHEWLETLPGYVLREKDANTIHISLH